MAIGSTIYKLQLSLSDMDRGVYGDHAFTLALHPSETEERLMMRVLAFALTVPADNHRGDLKATKGLSEPDEPDWWQLSLSGELLQWVEVGLPDLKRLQRAASRASERATFLAYASSTAVWWAPLENKLSRTPRLTVLHIPSDQSRAMAAMAQRSMQLQITVQDGTVWCHAGDEQVEVVPQVLLKS